MTSSACSDVKSCKQYIKHVDQFQFKRNNNDKSVDFRSFPENIMGGQKHSLNIVGPGQCQGSRVSFILHIDFQNIIRIDFILKVKNIYIVLTLVLIWVCQP